MANEYHFGSRSVRKLETCDDRLIAIAMRALGYGVLDFGIIHGHRGEDEQNSYYEQGVSQVRWPDSKHNKQPSLAFDFINTPVDWNRERDFVVIAGLILQAAKELGIPIRWGGDWNDDGKIYNERFKDLGHIELID